MPTVYKRSHLQCEVGAFLSIHIKLGVFQVLDATWAVSEGPSGMHAALDRICQEAEQAIQDGYSYLIISDRNIGQHTLKLHSDMAAIPVLLQYSVPEQATSCCWQQVFVLPAVLLAGPLFAKSVYIEGSLPYGLP